ncbi:MAG TPA: DUF5615 family PIN-like protein, partial [Isosphaeraceae bacterium]
MSGLSYKQRHNLEYGAKVVRFLLTCGWGICCIDLWGVDNLTAYLTASAPFAQVNWLFNFSVTTTFLASPPVRWILYWVGLTWPSFPPQPDHEEANPTGPTTPASVAIVSVDWEDRAWRSDCIKTIVCGVATALILGGWYQAALLTIGVAVAVYIAMSIYDEYQDNKLRAEMIAWADAFHAKWEAEQAAKLTPQPAAKSAIPSTAVSTDGPHYKSAKEAYAPAPKKKPQRPPGRLGVEHYDGPFSWVPGSVQTDEMISPVLIQKCIDRGLRVVTTQQAGLKGADDLRQLDVARRERRLILTLDRGFKRMHDDGLPHAGIVLAPEGEEWHDEIVR